MNYPAKVSYRLLFFVFVLIFAPIIPILLAGELNGAVIAVLVILIGSFVLVLSIFLGTSYQIDHGKLRIKCGPFSMKPVEIDSIYEISKTSSILSAPAPSFDRIELKYGKWDSVIISPVDQVGLIHDLMDINPSINNRLTV